MSAAPVSSSECLKLAPKTESDGVPDGENLPAGEAEREPGGDNVEAKREVAEGEERRSRRGREASERESGWASAAREWRCLDSLRAEAAMGKDWIGSVAEASS